MDISTIIIALLPTVVIAGLTYYFFKTFIKNEENRRNFRLIKESKKIAFPVRLQAYERITLLLERINPSQLLIRIKPKNNDKFLYANLLLATIEQEYEHNMSQQIYISEECWNVVISAKNTIASMISDASNDAAVNDAQEMREVILKKLMTVAPPAAVALSYLKKEVQELF